MNSKPQIEKQQKEDWKKEFRKLLSDLNDLSEELSIEEPIKGDIYFDGIEVEQFISQKLQEARAEERRKVREIMKLEIWEEGWEKGLCGEEGRMHNQSIKEILAFLQEEKEINNL